MVDFELVELFYCPTDRRSERIVVREEVRDCRIRQPDGAYRASVSAHFSKT